MVDQREDDSITDKTYPPSLPGQASESDGRHAPGVKGRRHLLGRRLATTPETGLTA